MIRMIYLLALMVLSAITPPSPRYVGPAKWKGSATNKPINRVVMHATVGAEPGTNGAAEATVAFSKRTDRPSSYHYIADAFKSLQYVFDSVVAFGAPPNEHSIHYELCCSLSNEGKGHWGDKDHQTMLRIAAKDVAALCLAYNIPIEKIGFLALRAGKRGICGHNDVRLAWQQTTHWDPGPFFPWRQFINLVKAEADLLVAPREEVETRGRAVENAIRELEKAAKKAKSTRLAKIQAALDMLRTIKPR